MDTGIKTFIKSMCIPDKYSSITGFLEGTVCADSAAKAKLAKDLKELSKKVFNGWQGRM